MCTAISISKYKHYFGRTLDLEYNYNENVIIVPRAYNLKFRYNQSNNNHIAFMGIGIIENNYPLFYDGCNEKGLCIAGLNLPFSTTYSEYKSNKINLCSFELIPFILSNCANCNEVKSILSKCNITNDSFNNYYNNSKLHFMVSDNKTSIVIEIINKNIIIYNNEYGVLTNEPSFIFHLENIKHYNQIDNLINDKLKGSHLLGLPGDNISSSRFVRSSINKKYFEFNENNISEIFNIFNSVFELNGLSKINDNSFYKTIYISIYNSTDNICYIKTYNCSNIIQINIFDFNLNGINLFNYTIYYNEKFIILK